MRLLWVVGLLLLPCLAWAQEQGTSEVTATAGWQYGGTQDFVTYTGYAYGDFHVNAAMNFGGALSYYVQKDYAAEITYTYQKSDLMIRAPGIPDTKLGDLSTHYIQLYGARYVPVRPEKVDAFLMGGVGATGYSVAGYQSRWVMSFGVGGGLRINTSERMAVRLQTRMLIPVQWANTGFYFGTGGANITVGGSSTLIQGDVSLGLVMRFGGPTS